jgi:hypothetical protein
MNMSKGPPNFQNLFRCRSLLVGVILMACALALVGCGPDATQPPPAPTDAQPIVSQPTKVADTPVVEIKPTDIPATQEPGPVEPDPEILARQLMIEALWAEGVHGDTYDLGKGPNTYCSRCHSPQNWDPASTVDAAPNCVTCKFATDPELRIASTMDFVSEEDWKGIWCDTCHQIEDGIVQPGFAWFNTVTNEHEPVNIPNELCQKCHVTSQGVQASGGRGVSHGIVLGGSAHLNWAGALPQNRRPEYCSECHDPHSGVPKQCVDCHQDVLTLDTHMKGHADSHVNVTCLACHEGSGMLVGPHPDPENDEWVTLVSSVNRQGLTVTAYEKSHSITWLVDCTRCHFVDNPWELIVLTADGAIPAPAE